MSANIEPSSFGTEWNALDRSERLRLRRLVRMGRSVDDPALARLAPDYARHQLARPWMRLFWLWFVPGVFVVFAAAAQVHPIVARCDDRAGRAGSVGVRQPPQGGTPRDLAAPA